MSYADHDNAAPAWTVSAEREDGVVLVRGKHTGSSQSDRMQPVAL